MNIDELLRHHLAIANEGNTYNEKKDNFISSMKSHISGTPFWIASERGHGKKHRMILRPGKEKPVYGCEYTKYMNGLVFLLYSGKRTLRCVKKAVPPPVLVVERDGGVYPPNKLDLVEMKPTIYALEDGTTVTIYYHNGSWTFSTTKAYDASNMEWNNILLFDALKECVFHNMTNRSSTDSTIDEVWESFIGGLNTKRSYTLTFHHTSMHPFDTSNARRYRIWHICTFDVPSNQFVDSSIGIPRQRKCKIKSKDMFASNEHAWQEWKDTGKVTFGYRVVYNNYQAIYESTLYNKIKHMIYSSKYDSNESYMRAMQLNKDQDYVCLKSVISYDKQMDFFDMFPEYKEKATTILGNIGKLCQMISHICTKDHELSMINEELYPLASVLFEKYKFQLNGLKGPAEECLEPVKFYIYDVKNINILYDYIDKLTKK